MKKLLFILLTGLLSVSSFGQLNTSLSFDPIPGKTTYYELNFPIAATHYIDGYTNTSGLTYTATVTDPRPCEIIWYLAADTLKKSSGTDSINVDVKLNHKKFTAETSFVTLKTVTVDGDANGDYASAILDSSYIIPTGSGSAGNKNIPLARPEFSRVFQLSITPTSGAGVGKLNDRFIVRKVYCKVIYR